MPTKRPSKNPITFIGEKNRIVFTDLIPTLRKIQRQKYAILIEQEKERSKAVTQKVKDLQREMERRFFTTDPKTKARKPFKFSDLSPKMQRNLERFLFRKIKQMDLSTFSIEQKEQLLADVRRLLFDIKAKKNRKQLLLKSTAKQQLLEDVMPDFNKLKEKDKRTINTIINYNLSLLTTNTYITSNEYNMLREKVVLEIKRINTNYVVIEEIKNELLSDPTTKRKFAEMSEIEKRKKLKQLDQIIRSNPRYATPSGRSQIERTFARIMVGANVKKNK
jgi:hypothetical protein